MFKLGLIINPYAGIGGRVGLKGSDGEKIRSQALAMGALQLANTKAAICIEQLIEIKDKFEIITAAGPMGEHVCESLGIQPKVVYLPKEPSTAIDTQNAVSALQSESVDILVFAGGDGTARDIYEVCGENQLVLGIPAGVKIHSGVYAVSPEAAGLLLNDLILGKLLSVITSDVMDIDESAFRQGIVKAKRYGELQVPGALEYIQAVKSGGKEVEALVLDDIAAEVIEAMEDDIYYIIGSGSTCAVIMQALGLPNTLLGIDIVYQHQIYQSDAIEQDLLNLLSAGKKLKFVITVIGGQGHILGRGNHQISPQVIRKAGWENFAIVATKTKLSALNGRPLLVDTGDSQLDHHLSGPKKVITGYRDYVVCRIGLR